MSLDRTRVEQQLARAKEELGAWAKALEQDGVASDAVKGDPRWRNLNARIRQISRRLNSIGNIEKVNAECETRKAEAASAEVEAAPEPTPAPKAKKAKAEPAAEGAPKKEKKEKKPKE
ncbi:MAG: hypothetical protein IT428_09460 [Planctomycetaceae bacterium]|nr:hypothetical protein [Planctomycetaceae bacterium]